MPPSRTALILSVSMLALTACAGNEKPPAISYDNADFKPAAVQPDAPKAVAIVTVPEQLPGQLLPPPSARSPRDGSPPPARVEAANKAAIQEPSAHGYINAVQVYPFTEGALYRLYAAPEQVTDITLQPGETLSSVSAGDTVRWVVGDTTSGTGNGKQAHILVKPFAPGLKSNLVIMTDRRSYHLVLESTDRTSMAAISWTYPQDQLVALHQQNERADAAAPIAENVALADLKFRYAITGDTPPWRPIRAFDDGAHVYIEFPSRIDQGEAPPLFVVGPEGDNQLVNYRVRRNYYIVDRLFAAAELRLGQDPQQVVRNQPDRHCGIDGGSGEGIVSDSGPSKLNPEALVLKAAPRRVVRFKRTLLIGIAAVGCIGLVGVTWIALKGSSFHPSLGSDELYGSARKNTPDALANLPGDYGQMAKPKPQLGPPLPGDLGPPIVEREKQLGVNPAGAEDEAARAERLRLAQQAQQAREATVFFQLNQHSGGIAPVAASTATPTTGATASPATDAGDGSDHLNLDIERDQNDQQHKADFVNQAAARGIYNDHALQTPASPYEVLAGTVISASLLTGLDSDLPGMVTAQVTEAVHDSVTDRILLVPQGSRLIGAYDSVVAFGQSRALLVWQRIVMPDGSSIQIDNLPATDAAGYAGLEDEVDYHTWTLLKGIAMSTLLGVGTQVTFGSGQSNLVQAIQQSTQESTNQAGQRIIEKDINIQPTITIRPGFPLRVIVHKDLILRPYQG